MAACIAIGMLLYNAWKEDYAHKPVAISKEQAIKEQARIVADNDIPASFDEKKSIPGSVAAQNSMPVVIEADRHVKVKTDVFDLTIDKQGGDIVQLILSDYAEDQKTFGRGYVLFDNSPKRYYIAQSGLAGEQGPDLRGVGRAKFATSSPEYQMIDGENELTVDLKTYTSQGVEITKRFHFHRGSYQISVEYVIQNNGQVPYSGSFYGRLKRKPEPEKGGGFLGVQTFTGAAIHTQDTPYKKLGFKDIKDKPIEATVEGGFAAMVEHYFVSAWVPSATTTSQYRAEKLDNDIYTVGLVEPVISVLPGEEKSIKATLYAGPEITEDLKALAPGLDLAVDYGILWPICQPIFWLLKQLEDLTGNWGVAIILVTVIIKSLFYKLSASSYQSMGNMRKLQPRMEALKERYGEDKQKFYQAVKELYSKEKINPLGGCLPILVQIPVFIALYYVLLGSVELREAPFMLWITDLSAKDPFYVLPILMGASMIIQQKLNPAPADPIQAKVMMFMPVVFTVLFLSFPSGLVLYWFVNNMLSIAQQWAITRKIERAHKAHGAK